MDIKKWLYRFAWIPVFIIAVLFLVANRQPVTISLDPFSANNPAVTTGELPLWLWLIFTLFFGLSIGAMGMWLSGSVRRQKARQDHRELKALRREMAAVKRDAAQSPDGDLHSSEAALTTQKVVDNEPPLLESVSAS